MSDPIGAVQQQLHQYSRSISAAMEAFGGGGSSLPAHAGPSSSSSASASSASGPASIEAFAAAINADAKELDRLIAALPDYPVSIDAASTSVGKTDAATLLHTANALDAKADTLESKRLDAIAVALSSIATAVSGHEVGAAPASASTSTSMKVHD